MGVLESGGEGMSDNDGGSLGDFGISISPISSDSLLEDMEKQSRYDRLLQKMVEVGGGSSVGPSTYSGSSACLRGSSSSLAVPVPALATSVPSAPSSVAKTRGKPSNATATKPFSMEREEGDKEDPAPEAEKAKAEGCFGGDSAWKHKVNPIDRAFPPDYNLRVALDADLTNGPIREILGPLVPEQLIGTAQFLACQLTACLQVGVKNTFATKVQLEKELAATKDQVDVLTAERDFALASPLLHAKIKSLSKELERAEGERLTALDRMKEVEERAKVQAAELESCHSALEQENKKFESLTQSFKGKQTALDEAEAATVHWRGEWKSLAEETGEMVQETFEILMDQVRHLNPAIDYSIITLDTRWDPKAKRIYNPKAETQEQPDPVVVDQPEPVAEEQPEVLSEQQVEEVVAEEGSENLASFDGAKFVGAFSERFDHPVGTFPVRS
ncbi:hypothetical protein PIB30_078362 [Stylosanthes scabra]|uniref:Uncharacterized protein n=1 Tax=Stylosanthes scabra TaxID=79078 RepID=A0ABU6WQP9_9FABA|nr:hypothetical protein [Stylosanthes scabra]